jgi:sugar-specific transcriptional regulator TrmB
MKQLKFLKRDHPGTELLEKLGLTNLQTRIYLSLISYGSSTVAEISKITTIARQDIYKILPYLLTLGIIEKIIETPAKYKAVPLKDAISKLFDSRKKESIKLHKKAKEFCEYFSKKDIRKNIILMDYDFIIIPKKKRLVSEIKKTMQTAQRNADIIISKETSKAIFLFLSDFEKTVQRGVKIRFLANKSEKIRNWLKENKTLIKNPNFNIKFSDKIISIRAGLYDKQKLILATQPSTLILDSPALLTNNSVIIELFQSYFNSIWNKIKEY